MLIIAIEGCSHAGKTTLIKNLGRQSPDLIPLVDYVTFAGGDDKVPPAPAKSVAEELEALEFFLNLDNRRWRASVKSFKEDGIILADRSFHTLLAHRLAIQDMTGMSVFTPSCEAVRARKDLLLPDLILYLDTPQYILDQRYKTRISSTPVDGHTKNYDLKEKMKLVFNKHEYNRSFRQYFLPTLQFGDTPIVILDGALTAEDLMISAMKYVDDMRQ